MNIALVFRGIPGSGKSYFTNLLISLFREGLVVHSTDQKHMVNGEYRWDASKVREYHKQNFEEFTNSLINGVKLVIVDNTNLAHKEYAHYIEEAKNHGYKVYSVVFEPSDPQTHFDRNTHNVPRGTIEAMFSRFSLETPGVDGQFLIPKQFGPLRDGVVAATISQIEQGLQIVH